jgi:hypothetical protein
MRTLSQRELNRALPARRLKAFGKLGAADRGELTEEADRLAELHA